MTTDTDTYPVWTVRYTWRVTDSRDQPVRTYETADGEANAVDRAVFVLDHYQNSATRALVCVDVKQPDGTWADVPRSNTRLTGPVRFAFQRPPGRPV